MGEGGGPLPSNFAAGNAGEPAEEARAATFEGDFALKKAAALGGDDVDDATDGVGAVEGAFRAAADFDPADEGFAVDIVGGFAGVFDGGEEALALVVWRSRPEE